VAADPIAGPEGTQFCENCGCRLAPEDVFCCECGARNEPPVEVADTPPTLPSPIVKAPPAQPEPEPLADEPIASDSLSNRTGQERDYPDNALPGLVPAPAALFEGEEEAEGAPDRSFEYEPAVLESRARGMLVWVLAGVMFLGASGSAGYFWRDRLTALAGLDNGATASAEADAVQTGVPRVAGTYTSFLMDQEIEIFFEGDPAVLAESKGTVRYFNTVNGGRCVSQLVAIESGGIGGDPSGKVLFSQQPKEGEPPCGKDIPMLIDIDRQAMGEDGLVSRLAIEWQSPETKEVLMSGNLEAKE
jgi:hypothetical protein